MLKDHPAIALKFAYLSLLLFSFKKSVAADFNALDIYILVCMAFVAAAMDYYGLLWTNLIQITQE